jgi:hypothetical protein
MSREVLQQALEYIERHAVIDGIAVRDALRKALAQPEPVAWIDDNGNLHRDEPPYSYGPDPRPLYASPAQRQPLTNEQKLMCWSRATCDADVGYKTEHQCLMDYGSEIEAAHGIGDKT